MYKLLVVVLLSHVVRRVVCDEVVLNNLVDLLLEGVEEEMSQGGKDQLAKVPGVNKVWEKSLGPISVRAQVVCSGGRISSLASIKRNGDVILKKESGNVSLRANLWIEQLKISYDNCQVKAAGISTSDPLTLTASHVNLITQISMARTPNNCTNDLDYMVVTDLGKLTSDMGSGVWASIKESLLEFIARRNHDRIINSLNHKLESAATKALMKRKNFCTKIYFSIRN